MTDTNKNTNDNINDYMNDYDNTNDDTNGLFQGGEFVVMQKDDGNGKKEFIGGGYKVNSFFLQEGISPMTTYNTDGQSGGKVSSPFENLAVPAGLFYVNMRVPKLDSEKKAHLYEKHTTISDDMMDKLFGLVEDDKKRKRKTRKSYDKSYKSYKSDKSDKSKIKTRKHKNVKT